MVSPLSTAVEIGRVAQLPRHTTPELQVAPREDSPEALGYPGPCEPKGGLQGMTGGVTLEVACALSPRPPKGLSRSRESGRTQAQRKEEATKRFEGGGGG